MSYLYQGKEFLDLYVRHPREHPSIHKYSLILRDPYKAFYLLEGSAWNSECVREVLSCRGSLFIQRLGHVRVEDLVTDGACLSRRDWNDCWQWRNSKYQNVIWSKLKHTCKNKYQIFKQITKRNIAISVKPICHIVINLIDRNNI